MVKVYRKPERIMKLKSKLTNKIQICTDKVQSNTGANQAVTNNKESMYIYSDIDPYPIGGVTADKVAIVCTGHGLLPWQAREGNIVMVRTMYCREVNGTIISPTTVVQQNQDQYHGFTIESNCNSGSGILTLQNRNGKQNSTYSMTLQNGLRFQP